MQQITIVVVLASVINTQSHVITPTKHGDLTTSLPLDNQAQNISDIKSGDKRKEMKSFNLNDSSVYLEDVVYALKFQNWTEDERSCLNMTLLLIQNLQNFTLWAVWNWDAISSQPQGLLYGSKFHLGNFDECMNPPWYKEHPELRSQYCLADIVLERTDNPVRNRNSDLFDPYQSALNLLESRSRFLRPLNELTWGACVPAVCQTKSVEKLMGTLLAHSHLGTAGLRAHISVNEPCQKDEYIPFDGVFYSFVAVMGSLTILVLICTYLTNRKEDSKTDTLQYEIIKAFDVNTNAANLLKVSGDRMDVLYGFKFLSMCIIVSAHQHGLYNSGPISNGSSVDKSMLSVMGLIFLHEDIIVDSFFMLSGFLVATFFAKAKKFPNMFHLFFKRYIRLNVAFAVVIFYICAIFPYTGSGPLWLRAVAGDTEQCRKNWWLSLLMLSNYVDSENICLVVSWYVPCDFHFFVFTTILYWIYKQCPKTGRALAIIITIIAVITPGIINYVYKLPAIQMFTYDFISNPRGPLQFHLTYIKSHTRYPAYLIGFFAGCLYIYCVKSENFNKIPRKWSILGACLSIFTMGAVMFSGPTFLWRSYDALESAVYATLNRPVWALCCATFVLCCLLGHVPFAKSFLSWYPWVPLSRLSYGLYLMHTVIIARNVFVTRNPQHNDYWIITTSTLGIICEGTIAALIIWLVAEAPVNNLINLYFKSSSRTKAQENNRARDFTVNDDKTINSGHLENNMPSTVEIISSKI